MTDQKQLDADQIQLTDARHHYRVGDVFRLLPDATDSALKNFPGSIMNVFLKKEQEERRNNRQKTLTPGIDKLPSEWLGSIEGNEKTLILSTVLDNRCDRDEVESDCLVSLRTGDVLEKTWGKNHDKKIPAHPRVVADAVANCSSTTFMTGRHGNTRKSSIGNTETDAYMNMLEDHLMSANHAFRISENNCAQDVDDDVCVATSFSGNYWRSSGGFNDVIESVRRHRGYSTSTDLAYKEGNVVCVSNHGVPFRYTAQSCETGDKQL